MSSTWHVIVVSAVCQETHGRCCYSGLNSIWPQSRDTYIRHPRHRPVYRSSGTTRTCHRRLWRFWLELPPLLSSFSTVKLFRLPRLTYTSPAAAVPAAAWGFPRRGQWLESIADCNVSQINKLRYKVIKQSAADNITEKLDCKIVLDKNNAVRTLERRYLSDAAALITVLYRQKVAKYNPNLSGSLSNFLFLK